MLYTIAERGVPEKYYSTPLSSLLCDALAHYLGIYLYVVVTHAA